MPVPVLLACIMTYSYFNLSLVSEVSHFGTISDAVWALLQRDADCMIDLTEGSACVECGLGHLKYLLLAFIAQIAGEDV